jgi:hypothetical protein
MTRHEWHAPTSEGSRYFRATRFARAWQIATRLKHEAEWTRLDRPWEFDVVLALRDLLWAKYQRRKVPYEVVAEIDVLLPDGWRRTGLADSGEPAPNPRAE